MEHVTYVHDRAAKLTREVEIKNVSFQVNIISTLFIPKSKSSLGDVDPLFCGLVVALISIYPSCPPSLVHSPTDIGLAPWACLLARWPCGMAHHLLSTLPSYTWVSPRTTLYGTLHEFVRTVRRLCEDITSFVFLPTEMNLIGHCNCFHQ